MKELWIDKYVFKWLKKELADATLEEICAFYVDKFIFRNEDYFKHLQETYTLPNDLLGLHQKIVKLSED